MTAAWPYPHDRVWDNFTQKWWCVCEQWTSDSAEPFDQHLQTHHPDPYCMEYGGCSVSGGCSGDCGYCIEADGSSEPGTCWCPVHFPGGSKHSNADYLT